MSMEKEAVLELLYFTNNFQTHHNKLS